MPRGYRLFVVALGLILCGAKPPQEHAESQPSTQTNEQAAADSYAPYAGYNPDPCYQAKDHDAADLCAQWRASIAAEKAAHEARRATNWAIVATLLSAVGLGFIMWSLWQTGGALGEARRGNRIAMKAHARATRQAIAGGEQTATALAIAKETARATAALVELSDKNAQRQLRAYLAVTDCKIEVVSSDSFYGSVKVSNLGSTPAYIKRVTRQCWIGPPTQIHPQQDGPPGEVYYHLRDVIIKDIPDVIRITLSKIPPSEFPAHLIRELYVYGRIDYADVFGQGQWVNFAFRLLGSDLVAGADFIACVYGNDAS